MRAWLTQVKPVMTSQGWEHLAAVTGDDGGIAASTAAAHHWLVQAQVSSCSPDPDAGPATSTRQTITCQVLDTTVGATGIPVPTAELPNLWPYNGLQPPAVLAMHRLDGRWLVDADETGQAG